MTPEELIASMQKKDFNYFLGLMLDEVPSDIDKRQGSIIYDALAPAAMIAAQQSMTLADIVRETYVKTADNEFLDYRAAEHGTERQLATKAQVKIKALDRDDKALKNIEINDRFASLGDEPIFYTVIEIKEDLIIAEAEEVGTKPNGYLGQILPITPNDELNWAEIVEITIPARDAETDDHLRDRLLGSDSWITYGGNVSDYLDMTSKIEEVGTTQIYPVWNGGGTVKLVILDNDLMPASEELLEKVKDEIDPQDSQSLGYGLAPIDHLVTVVAPEKVEINIDLKVEVDTQSSLEAVKPKIIEAIEDYFKLERQRWNQVNQLVGRGYSLIVYRSQILNSIMNVEGVINAQIPQLNGEDKDISMIFSNQVSQLPVLKDVNINA